MNRVSSTFSMSLGLVVLLITLLSCNNSQTEMQTTLFDQYYKIAPTSLMNSLKTRNMNAFIPVNEKPEFLPPEQQVSIDWLQADYIYIANALYNDVRGKTLQGWNLKGMDFQLDCSKTQNGFQNGRFEFFKVVKEKEQDSRTSRFIDIDPRANFVHVIEDEYYPNLVDLEVIDLVQLKISADLALKIAEGNGGKEKRQLVQNGCNIYLGLYPNSSSYTGWEVSYTRKDDRTSFFHLKIDPVTGEIHFP